MRPRKCTRLNCRYLKHLCTVQRPDTNAAFTSDEQQRIEGKRRGELLPVVHAAARKHATQQMHIERQHGAAVAVPSPKYYGQL